METLVIVHFGVLEFHKKRQQNFVQKNKEKYESILINDNFNEFGIKLFL